MAAGFRVARRRRAACVAAVCALAAAVPAMSAAAPDGPATFDCIIEPNLTVKVGSQATGVLESVEVDRGDFVKKGDVIGKLFSDVERAAVSLARARANSDTGVKASQSRLDFEIGRMQRSQRLFKRKVISNQEFDRIRTEVELRRQELKAAQEQERIAKLELERARAILRLRTIRSPVDGVVVSRSLSPGEFVLNEGHIVTIAKIDPLNVEVFVPAALMPRIAVGMHATVIPEPPYRKNHDARVTIVDSVIDAASGTFGVRLSLPNPTKKIPAGLRCRAAFFARGG